MSRSLTDTATGAAATDRPAAMTRGDPGINATSTPAAAAVDRDSILVQNPLAAPATFRHELTDHHLHISLQLIQGSPSIVKTLAYIGTDSHPGWNAV
jgi:hypothetical protein